MKIQLVFDEKPRRGGGNGARTHRQSPLSTRLMFLLKSMMKHSIVLWKVIFLLQPNPLNALCSKSDRYRSIDPAFEDTCCTKELARGKALPTSQQKWSENSKNIEDLSNKVSFAISTMQMWNGNEPLARDRKEIKLLKRELRKVRCSNSSLNNK